MKLKKIFDFSKENSFVNEYLKNLYTKLNFDSEEKFNEYIKIHQNILLMM